MHWNDGCPLQHLPRGISLGLNPSFFFAILSFQLCHLVRTPISVAVRPRVIWLGQLHRPSVRLNHGEPCFGDRLLPTKSLPTGTHIETLYVHSPRMVCTNHHSLHRQVPTWQLLKCSDHPPIRQIRYRAIHSAQNYPGQTIWVVLDKAFLQPTATIRA